MKETVRSLRLYFAICAFIQIASGLSNLVAFSLLGLVLAVFCLVPGGLYAYIAFRLPQMLATSTRLVTITLAVEAGVSLLVGTLGLVATGRIGSLVFYLAFGVLLPLYLYRNVQRLSAEAVGASGQQVQGLPPPGYAAPSQGYAAHAQGYGAPQQGYAPPPGYGPPPQMPPMPQPPLGPGMHVIVTAPSGQRTPATILQEQNGHFLCDSQGGQGWVPMQFVTRA